MASETKLMPEGRDLVEPESGLQLKAPASGLEKFIDQQRRAGKTLRFSREIIN